MTHPGSPIRRGLSPEKLLDICTLADLISPEAWVRNHFPTSTWLRDAAQSPQQPRSNDEVSRAKPTERGQERRHCRIEVDEEVVSFGTSETWGFDADRPSEGKDLRRSSAEPSAPKTVKLEMASNTANATVPERMALSEVLSLLQQGFAKL